MYTIKDIPNIQWYNWHRRKRTVLLCHIMYGPNIRIVKGLKYKIKVHSSCVDYILTKEDQLERASKEQWKKFREDNYFVLNAFDYIYGQNKKDIMFWQALYSKDYSKCSNQELMDSYNKYLDNILGYSAYIFFPLALDPLLSEEILKVLGDDNDALNIVMTPLKDSDTVEERRSLLNMSIKMKNGTDIKQDLKGHVEKFAFLKKNGMFFDFYTPEEYLKEINKIRDADKGLKTITNASKERQRRFRELLERYPDESTQLLFKTINECVYFRTWRTNMIMRSAYYLQALFSEIANRLSLNNAEDVLYLMPKEVISLLEQNRPAVQEIILQRRENYIYFSVVPDVEEIIQGKEALELAKKMDLFNADTNEVKGTPAFKGYFKGRATIVRGRDDYGKITKDTEVLVAHTTTTDIVTLIKNIKALVTEEGGILSHPSIISREMKIPAVIGTKTATKVLKDGDIVEVDADKGIVRKVD